MHPHGDSLGFLNPQIRTGGGEGPQPVSLSSTFPEEVPPGPRWGAEEGRQKVRGTQHPPQWGVSVGEGRTPGGAGWASAQGPGDLQTKPS